MKELLRYGFILTLICSIASGLLAQVNSLTKSRIISQLKAQEQSILSALFPQANNFEPITSKTEIIYYKAYDNRSKFIGVAFKAKAGGYSSDIETMAGMNAQGKMQAIKILSQGETPGLGSKIMQDSFLSQFMNIDIAELNKVHAITGATISSRAVIDSVNKKAEEIRELLK